MSNDDEFWGDKATWSPTTTHDELDRAFSRPRLSDSIRGAWRRVTDGGANPTREHGIVRPEIPAEHDVAHDGGFRAPAPTNHIPEEADVWVDAAAGSTLWSAEMLDDLDEVFADDHDLDHDEAAAARHGDLRVPARAFASMKRPSDERRIDPLVARLGAIAVVATLVAPFAMGLSGGSGDSDGDSVQTATEAQADATLEPFGGNGSTLGIDPATTIVVARPEAADTTSNSTASESDAGTIGAESAPGSVSAATDDTAETTVQTSATQPVGTVEALQSAPDELDEAVEVSDPADRVERTCAIDYEVTAGDFWIRIADGAGVELTELLEANGASTDTPIFPGRSICLPAGAQIPAPPTTTAAESTFDEPDTTAAPPTVVETTTTTTVAPTTAAPTTLPAGADASAAEVKQIIRDVWPDELEERAIEIAYRESNFIPTARNYCCHGVFQIYWNVHQSWLDDFGIDSMEDLYDPVKNTRAAYELYRRAGGWGPWGF